MPACDSMTEMHLTKLLMRTGYDSRLVHVPFGLWQ